MARRCWPLILLALSVLLACGAHGDGEEEELVKARSDALAQGTGPSAAAAAISNAQRRILAELLEGAFTLSDVTAANSVLDKAVLYIKSTQVVSTSTQGEQTKAEVECQVRRKRLLSDAALLLLPQLPFAPTVLLLVGERQGDQPPTLGPESAVGRILRGFYKDTEFELPASQQAMGCHPSEQIAAATGGDNELASRFAKERFADVLVIGLAKVAEQTGGINGSVVTSKVDLSLRIFRATDGKMLDAFSQQAVVHSAVAGEGVGQVIEDVCEKVKKDLLVACVIAATSLRTTDDLVVTVEEPGTKARFDALIKAMGAVPGVVDVEELLYTDGLARVRVSYGGHPGTFVRALETQRYEGEGLQVTRAVLRTVTMKFDSSQAPGARK